METRVLAICAISLIERGTSTCPETQYLVSGTRPIPDEYLAASSEGFPQNRISDNYSPRRSRLDTKEIHENTTWLNGGWAAQTNDAQQWIQARFLERSYITGIVTQGRNVARVFIQRVTSYQFHFSDDCVKFVPITKPNGDNETFTGNTDQDSHVTNMLPSPVRALCVRIQPVTWVDHITLRFDVIGCSCGSVLCSVNCNDSYCDNCTNCGTKCLLTCPRYCERNGTSHSCSANGMCRYGCTENHHGSVCDQKCSPYCAISSNGDVCSRNGSCLNGCISGYTGDKCESLLQWIVSEESKCWYKYGMIASLIVAFVAIVTIVIMSCLLRKKRLCSEDVANRPIRDRLGPAYVNQLFTETGAVYNDLDRKIAEDEPYALIN